MDNNRRFVLALLPLFAGMAFAQAPSHLTVNVPGKEPLRLTKVELARMPRATVEAKNDGIAVTYQGVWLHDVLKAAGAPGGSDLRGKALASYLVATAQDGYQAVYSLAEIDPVFTDNQVLLADVSDGKTLTGAVGPFRLIAPKDKRGARSVRMLEKIEVVLLRK
ncbi:MAG TPA: molybdopterin-dependent oxidoreductase [Bryobacteraceae bacterium]|nr:molybdopterin-dependent oxidoreductase [Bryobacteraceae bacterium]